MPVVVGRRNARCGVAWRAERPARCPSLVARRSSFGGRRSAVVCDAARGSGLENRAPLAISQPALHVGLADAPTGTRAADENENENEKGRARVAGVRCVELGAVADDGACATDWAVDSIRWGTTEAEAEGEAGGCGGQP